MKTKQSKKNSKKSNLKLSSIVRLQNGKCVFIDTTFIDPNDEFFQFLDSFLDVKGRREPFETMVFACNSKGKVKDWIDLDRTRYRTEAEAREGHKKMIVKWKRKLVL